MTLVKSIAVLAVLLAAITYFGFRARRLYRMLRLGPHENRFDRIPERIRGVLSYVGLHTRMFRNLYSGILHFFIFWGFVVLLTAIIQAFGEGIIPGFSLAVIGGNTWIAFLQDLFGVLVLVGVVMALVNRLIIQPRQFQESNEVDALIILDLSSCTECGRCQQQCPAFLTRKPLNPKMIIVDARENLYKTVRDAPAEQRRDAPRPQKLIGDAIKEDEIWACVACGACQQECPVLIEHVPKIMDMRRSLVLEESKFPKEAQGALRSIETQGNPYGLPRAQRTDWAQGLGVKTVEEHPGAEYLYFVGCAASYDEANRAVARAFVRLLQKAGVDFAILGSHETCNGDPARRIGNEYLYQTQAQQNIEAMTAAKVRKVIASCPHCFNTIKNEFPQFGGNYEVVHHTQLLASLVKEGRLRPSKAIDGRFTYHDSCYLGRWNDIYDPPREVIEAIPGAKLVEIERHRKRGFCCGAGGGRMWMEEKIGKRINHERVEQTLRTEAPRVATACPFCLTMFRDGIAAKGAEARLQVKDLAQYLAESIDGEAPRLTTTSG